MPITEFSSTIIPKGGFQTLSINKSKGKIEGIIRTFMVQDGKFKVAYIPAFDLTAYGKTNKEAREMLKEVLEDYFEALIALKLDAIKLHLIKHGWSPGVFKKKFENTKKLDNKGILRYLELPSNTIIKESALKVA